MTFWREALTDENLVKFFRTEFSILTINEIRLISGLPLYCSLRCQNAVGAIRVFFYAVGLSKTQNPPENLRYSCHKSELWARSLDKKNNNSTMASFFNQILVPFSPLRGRLRETDDDNGDGATDNDVDEDGDGDGATDDDGDGDGATDDDDDREEMTTSTTSDPVRPTQQ